MESKPGAEDHLRRRDVVCPHALAASIAWTAESGAQVDAGQWVATYGKLDDGTLRHVAAPCTGKLYMNTSPEMVGNDQEGTLLDAVGYVEYCIHPLVSGRTCMMCLAVVDESQEDLYGERQSVNVVSHGQRLTMNVQTAKQLDTETIQRQLVSKKLSLVLDLDHTLLHAVRVDDIVGTIQETDDMHYFYLPGFSKQQHVVKLRPGLHDFLQDLSIQYDLFIYTHGTRTYAEEIAKLIDPYDTIFQRRIVSRTDTPEMQHKSLKLLFPSCDDSMILIVDDRMDVWKENEKNVFLIEPYHYFHVTNELNNASGGSLEANGSSQETEESQDRHLSKAKSVLERVHTSFYDVSDDELTFEKQIAGQGRDVKSILLEFKKTILANCHLVFSGVFPIGDQRGPQDHYLWRLALDLGASPSMTLQDFPITHLVIHPGRLGTQKHVKVKAMAGVYVVTPEWLLKSARIWEKADESLFLADQWNVKKVATEPKEPPASKGEPPASKEEPPASKEEPPAPKEEPSASKETTPPSSILKSSEQVTQKPKRNVSFAVSEEPREKKVLVRARSSGAGGQKRPVKRRPMALDVEKKGTVASGGAIDFVSRIAQIKSKREVKVDKQEKKREVEEKKEEVKDVDDALSRLLAMEEEAEEEDLKQEQKRKLESTDVRDVLAKRRKTVEEEQDLDDLEDDILGL